MTKQWTTPAHKTSVEKTIAALKNNGIEAFYFENEEEAKKKALSLIPHGAEVMDMTSVTLDSLGIVTEIQHSGKYNAVKPKLYAMDRKTQKLEMQKLGSAPEYAIGSANAVTEDGKVIIASATGSQMPAYAYGANHVIWIVGTQKIVKNLDEALQRIDTHVLPLESERARQAYGVPGSSVNKLLIINKEFPGRMTIIFVGKQLGF